MKAFTRFGYGKEDDGYNPNKIQCYFCTACGWYFESHYDEYSCPKCGSGSINNMGERE
jgi:rubrerythrin